MKKILKFLPLILATLVIVAVVISYAKAYPTPYPNSVADSEIPTYEEIRLDYTHVYNGDKFLPVVGSAAIDIDQDGISEIFVGGGENQDDAIYKIY